MNDQQSTAEIQAWLTRTVAHYVKQAEHDINADVPLARYGLDSVYAFALWGEIEDAFELSIDPTVLWDIPTVAGLAEHLSGLLRTARPNVVASAPMTTSLLDRKLDRAFGHLDIDHSGHVDHDDMIALAARITAAFNESADGPKGQVLIDAFHTFWEDLISAIDLDGDRRITPDEWRAGMVGAYVERSGGFEASLRPAAKAALDLADTDNNGTLSADEFRVFQGAFGTTPEDADQGFARLDADGDGNLTVDELVEAARLFYTSREASTGDWLFGPL